ncbi:di-trans,poly-cis-decaprenylcistransferase [Candidatus Woesearchaeota archaeon]|nr:di-trans,poly-cis-decaprenylcistransferase [Candidatus Woesearchaeota archaeon]
MDAVQNSVPKHIGIIIDGNRRFAKQLMLKPWKGHELGYEKVKRVLEWCKEINIKELTLYAFSIENFDRPKEEFDYLMNLFEKAFTQLRKEEEKIKNMRINFIGRIKMFPREVYDAMTKLMDATKNNVPFIVNFAMAYGGRAEIIDAVKKIAEQVKEGKVNIENINEELFSKNTYLHSDPDLIIRTSESRLSGFLTWQSVYSEIIFLPNKLWPEFEKEDFLACIEEYKNRQRRFGK